MKFLAGTREQVVEDDWHHTEETMAPGHVTGEAMWTGSTTFYILPDKEDNYGYYVWRQEDHQGIMPSKIKKERKQDLQFLRWQDASMWYTLQHVPPPLPLGCRLLVLELCGRSGITSRLAQTMGDPARGLDAGNGWDMRQSEHLVVAEKLTLEMDPLCILIDSFFC